MMVGHAMIVDGGQTAAAAREEDRAGFVSVGRYALRGVARAQELFTLDRMGSAR
jgi:adenylate cyclase